MPAILESRKRSRTVDPKSQPSIVLQAAQDDVDETISRSQELISRHPHFRCRELALEFEVQDNRLIIRGQMSSFFHKQLVQEAIRGIDSLVIDNRIVVSG